MFKLANRVLEMTESATLRMAQLARKLASEGHDVINLSLGEPDFDTPDFIKQAAIESLKAGFTKYTPVAGTLELRKAISQKFLRDNNLEYGSDEVMVSNGAKQCFANLCFACLEPGDEAVILSPYWVSYYEIIKLTGATPVCVESDVQTDYKPDLPAIRKALSPKTKLFVFSSPCNPTGTVFTENELRAFAEILQDFPDVLVVSDEIYEYIQFGTRHFSIGSLPSLNNRTATINGFSKGYSMTGWRLGYMGGPKAIIEACVKIQGQFTSGAASFSQQAAIKALQSDMSSSKQMCQAYEKRRNLLLNELKSIPEFKVNKPQGAFYVLPEVKILFGKSYQNQTIRDSEDLALFLLTEAKVAIVSGIAFGAPDCIRISYSLSEEKITEAVTRMRRALDLLV
ncbi:MAG: pyridoxal phosphate-dependent aminotransferase [Saprospiraceae bacterium]|nr:pyridoxal phosphate-dependent aminotransferase [Saprospiraceae bacterium]